MQQPIFPEREQGYKNLSSNSHILAQKNDEWYAEAVRSGYMYQWNWFGIPLIQFPQDMMALQQIITTQKPTIIIETGVARGGSSAFYASMLHLAHLGTNQDYKVISIDIEIREHTREALSNFVLRDKIQLVEASSTSSEAVSIVEELIQPNDTVMVCLDSNHTTEHVSKELDLYSSYVSPNNYLVVFDTAIHFLDDSLSSHRPWSSTNNPYIAVERFLPNSGFVVDDFTATIGGPTSAPGGYLKRTSEYQD